MKSNICWQRPQPPLLQHTHTDAQLIVFLLRTTKWLRRVLKVRLALEETLFSPPFCNTSDQI